MSKFYNVCTRKTIVAGEEEKKVYHKVGVIKVTQNQGWFLQFYHQSDTEFMIFSNHDEQLPVITFDDRDTA